MLAPLPARSSVDAVLRALRAAGAGAQCYVVSAVLAADGRELPLRDAVGLAGRAEDSVVFALGSRVAYYENHEGDQYLLWRRD